ncbi:fumarylacetoacetate hydrolase family protein [Altererythrobacter sp.]|uniref:fumarylacetoacetate hydrolase family protein n=1 Tax=Altererythrobacter sp. TaxID=1872480 RepID=UPI003D038E66
MKLLRFGDRGAERPGLLDADGRIRDLSGVIEDIDGAVLSPSSLARLAELDPSKLPLVEGDPRLGPCVGNIGKFLCIGLNFTDHAAETGATPPSEPIMFTKATSAVSGPNDPIIRPRGSTKLDWEVELALVIGSPISYADVETARSAIAGYCICNDVSEREFQLERGGSWDKGKGCDSFGPIGPWLVTADEVGNPGNLDMWLEVNGTRYQDGTSANMIFDCAAIVSYVSQFMSLQSGDVITTGTPAGVGMGLNPPRFLVPGDVVELGIAGLGVQRQVVVDCD